MRILLQPSSCIFTIVLASLFFTASSSRSISQSAPEFMFFRITVDKKLYDQNPSKYNKEGSGKTEVYIEREPSLRIQADEVESITIDRHRIAVDIQDFAEALKEELGYKTKSTEAPGGFEYSASFFVTEAAADRWRYFARKNDGEYIQWRFGNTIMGENAIVGPFSESSRAFSIGLRERNTDRIAEILAPLKNKVAFKD